MALHTDTEIYKSTYDLSKLVTQLVANMPRNFKADFGAELRRRCMTLVMRTYEANTSVDKAAVLQRMRMEIETVNLSAPGRGSAADFSQSVQPCHRHH
jgi:hypothetical protein